MLVKEYFKLKGISNFHNVTFIKARARKDAHSPFYHAEYQTTPIMTPEHSGKLLDYIVLNDQQPPIEWASSKGWTNWYNGGYLLSLLVISKEDLNLLYPGDQGDELAEFIGKKIRENIK